MSNSISCLAQHQHQIHLMHCILLWLALTFFLLTWDFLGVRRVFAGVNILILIYKHEFYSIIKRSVFKKKKKKSVPVKVCTRVNEQARLISSEGQTDRRTDMHALLDDVTDRQGHDLSFPVWSGEGTQQSVRVSEGISLHAPPPLREHVHTLIWKVCCNAPLGLQGE